MFLIRFLCHKRSTAMLLFVAASCAFSTVNAQLNPLGSQYFQNEYLFNPAMAGISKGLQVNLAVRQQWSSIPGSPATQIVSADYLLNRAAFGLNVYNDQSGLLRTTRAVATYAYHITLGRDQRKLNFGLSAGVLSQRVPIDQIIGDASDISVSRYNERESYVDGDFGASYTSNSLNIQAALPNLRSVFGEDKNNYAVDRSLFFSAISYKFNFGEGLDAVGIEPKVCFRGVKGYTNIVDAGANLMLGGSLLSIQAMYHSSKSTTAGIALNKANYSISAFYTTETAAISNYTNGDFELSLRLSLLNKP